MPSIAAPQHPVCEQSRSCERAVQSVIRQRLSTDPHLQNRPLACVFHEGTAVLRGTVGCYYHKQIAQIVAAGVDGVQLVINDIEVEDPLHPSV